jgi:hypothetical protein
MFNVALGSFPCVMRCLVVMTVRHVGMVCCLFMVPGFMVLCGFLVVSGCVFVVLSGFVMMLGSFFCQLNPPCVSEYWLREQSGHSYIISQYRKPFTRVPVPRNLHWFHSEQITTRGQSPPATSALRLNDGNPVTSALKSDEQSPTGSPDIPLDWNRGKPFLDVRGFMRRARKYYNCTSLDAAIQARQQLIARVQSAVRRNPRPEEADSL